MSLSTFPVLAYHGCDEATADAIINGRMTFDPSTNEYDWLGEGTYFWVGSYSRALDWAHFKKTQGKVTTPSVICALVELRFCLNLTDLGITSLLSASYTDLKAKLDVLGKNVPENSPKQRFGIPLYRNRDCAVIQNLHRTRESRGETPYDTVIGAFEEGPPAFEGAAVRERSHIQLAVRSHTCIRATVRTNR